MTRTLTIAGLLAAMSWMPSPTAAQRAGDEGDYRSRESGPVDSRLDAAWRNFQHRPATRTSPYDASDGWGFRNPGHVGRVAEYYPPGNQFQNPGSPVEGARFSQGPVSTRRSMQLQSQMVGIARYNAIQGHIDRYGTPRIGWGWGFGGLGVGFR